ncbi:MAG: hypothetical protein HKM05_06990 [Spirochaetales bacterium]|nr:hypothetical protein [Spirochaetales bacterium]
MPPTTFAATTSTINSPVPSAGSGKLKEVYREHDTNRLTMGKVVELLSQKIEKIEHKQAEFKRILQTLQGMREAKIALMNDSGKNNALFKLR